MFSLPGRAGGFSGGMRTELSSGRQAGKRAGFKKELGEPVTVPVTEILTTFNIQDFSTSLNTELNGTLYCGCLLGKGTRVLATLD